jgi:peptide/nickel transport system permease protein
MTTTSIWGILASRLLQGLLVVFLVVTAVFVVGRMTRDPIAYLADIQSTDEEIDALRERFGLNDPLYVQYGNFLWNTAQLDMGRSLLNGRPALNEVTSRITKTLQLGAGSLLFALVLGLSTGVVASLRRGRVLDWLARLLAVIG